MKNKKKPNQIFNSVRKRTAPPTKKFKTRKNELEREKKHKRKEENESTSTT